jgi:hypothetical protein
MTGWAETLNSGARGEEDISIGMIRGGSGWGGPAMVCKISKYGRQ